MQIEQHKCAHRPCLCVVATDTQWCSPECEEAQAQEGDAAVCECAHADCERAIGIPEGVALA
ncbi:MAG TPA: hypothetical protein VIZ64_08150 [Dokdonella sp.]